MFLLGGGRGAKFLIGELALDSPGVLNCVTERVVVRREAFFPLALT